MAATSSKHTGPPFAIQKSRSCKFLPSDAETIPAPFVHTFLGCPCVSYCFFSLPGTKNAPSFWKTHDDGKKRKSCALESLRAALALTLN